jgi:hypothetical protein
VADATAPFVDKQIDEIADAIAEARGQAEIEVEAPTV